MFLVEDGSTTFCNNLLDEMRTYGNALAAALCYCPNVLICMGCLFVILRSSDPGTNSD